MCPPCRAQGPRLTHVYSPASTLAAVASCHQSDAASALHEELQGYLARYQALLHTDVPAFNTLAGQHGMGGVIAR